MIDKLKKFVQKALKLPEKVAIVQVGNSRQVSQQIEKEKKGLELLGTTVEWYYFDSDIKASELDFEIYQNLLPFVDKVILRPPTILEEKYIEEYQRQLKGIKDGIE